MKKGFTLIEVLLSIALIGSIAAISAPFFLSNQTQNDVDVAATTLAQSIRRAESLSQANFGDLTWGIKIQTGSIVIFQGVDFNTRNQDYDEIFTIPSNMQISGNSEILFSKVNGFPTPFGSTTLTSPDNNTKTITINAKGIINY